VQPHICTPEQFLEWTGRKMHPSLQGLRLTGSRILVARFEAPETWTSDPDSNSPGIIIPDTVRSLEPPGAGVIVGVGPTCGKILAPYPGALEVNNPEDVLGLQVYFKMHTGVSFRLDIRDREFQSEMLILTDRDIQAWIPRGPAPFRMGPG